MQYQNGGHIRIISNLGNGGQHGAGGLICSYDTYANGGQIVESSPAVGNFLANNYVGIASGMGYFSPYPGPPNRIVVINRHCGVVWQRATDFETSSPILADVNGDGRLDVIVGTQAVSQFGGSTSRGSVYAFDGSTGTLLWRVATGSVVGAPVAADLTGKGYADVVVTSADAGPTTGGLQIIDGKTGTKVWSEQGIVGQNSPLVTADPDGTIGITIAGYVGELRGSGACQQSFCLASTVAHYTIPGSSAQWLSRAATSWLQFHHDPQLSGNMAGPNG
jgi:outer membrane protein assembly factor BamB